MNNPHRTGAAHAGLIEWLVQRLTAVYLLIFVVIVLFVVGKHAENYGAWTAWFEQPVVRWGWMLFFISALWHGWIGLRSIFLDYIHPFWLRLGLTVAAALILFVQFIWAAEILFKIGSKT